MVLNLTQTQKEWILDESNEEEVKRIYAYLEKNNLSEEAKAFAQEAIIRLSQPDIESNTINDYEQAVLKMAAGLRKFHGEEENSWLPTLKT